MSRKSDSLTPEEREEVKRFLTTEAEKEMSKPPRIAIIGKAGVGKTSTINALFGTKLRISHVKACTQHEQEVSLGGTLLTGAAGHIIVYDMPGLGQDLEADERHKSTYTRVIAQCDVAVWVLEAAGSGRAMAYDQLIIRDVLVPANINLVSRLVVGLNKVDLMQPGHWVEIANVPSKTQRESLRRRISDIQDKLVKVIPRLSPDRIIPYSATKRFHLQHLFEAMLNACAHDRAWVLHNRRSIADYRELINPRILELVRSRQKGE